MKVLLWGSQGQLGRELAKLLPGEVIGIARADADLVAKDQVHDFLERSRPDVVVNCAAYNLVDRSETQPDEAFAVNTWAIRNLAQWCGQHDVFLVHFSSDYVFGLDAGRRVPYREDVAPGPINVYGQSKLCGEYWVRQLCERHLVVRTSGLYGFGQGGKGRNFPDTMLRLAADKKTLRVVDDQICTPTFTLDLAQATVRLLEAQACGLFHWTNSGQCSWFEFARTLFDLSNQAVALEPITSGEYGAAARRPRFSVLEPASWSALGLDRPRGWQEALADYVRSRSKLPLEAP